MFCLTFFNHGMHNILIKFFQKILMRHLNEFNEFHYNGEREKERVYFRRRFSRIEKLNKKYEYCERSF